jgi:UPF0042 nucleotide-binding protein
MQIVIVTGLAGAGKSTALRALEDLGFFCCDNLPARLFQDFVEGLAPDCEKAAISIDGRQRSFVEEYKRQVKRLRDAGHDVEILFLEASDQVLVRRFSETRRRHPLSGEDIVDGIRQDREGLAELRQGARVVNTGGLNVHELRTVITQRYGTGGTSLVVNLQSFGFKYGIPVDANLVFDVRYLPNPHFDPVLGPMDGRDRDVSDYVFSESAAVETLRRVEEFLTFSIPLHAEEGKLYLTVAIGCTGGKHRSVAMVEELCRRLGERWHVLVRHRDLTQGRAVR